MNEQIDEKTNGWMNKQIDGPIKKGWIVKQKNKKRMNKQLEVQIERCELDR